MKMKNLWAAGGVACIIAFALAMVVVGSAANETSEYIIGLLFAVMFLRVGDVFIQQWGRESDEWT